MSSPTVNVRLPSPPPQYSQGQMTRLINTLEIIQQNNVFAQTTGQEKSVEIAEQTAWFLA